MTSRRIYIIGDIDVDAFKAFCIKLRKLEDESNEDIIISLCSGGGDGNVGLAFYDRLQASPCYIRCIATGLVASAAVAVLMGCDKRDITEHGWVMSHEEAFDDDEFNKAKVHSVEASIKYYRRIETQYNKILARHTNIDAATWARLHKKDTYFSAAQCLKHGLVHEVLK